MGFKSVDESFKIMFFAEVFKLRSVVVNNKNNKDESIDKVLKNGKVAGEDCLKLNVKESDKGGGDYCAVDIAHSAENDHNENFDGIVIAELGALDGEVGIAVKNAGNSRKERGNGKNKKFVFCDVNTGCSCGNFVVADSGDGSSVFGTYKVLGNRKGCKNHYERDDKEDIFVETGSIKTEGAAEGFLAGVHENRTDDFAEGKGYYRKIVATKTKGGKTDYHSEKRGDNSTDYKGNEKSGPFAENGFQNNRGFSAEICADAHKSRMTEGKFPKKTDNHAERNGKGYRDCNFFKKIFIGTVD